MVKHTGLLSELLLRNRHSLMLSFTLQRYKKFLKLPNIFVVFLLKEKNISVRRPYWERKEKQPEKVLFFRKNLEDKRKMRIFVA